MRPPQPTAKMRTDAASAGFYKSPWGTSHPKLQILTVTDLSGGKGVDMPSSLDVRTFKRAPRAKKASDTKPLTLEFGESDD